jgi:hypothetical protein
MRKMYDNLDAIRISLLRQEGVAGDGHNDYVFDRGSDTAAEYWYGGVRAVCTRVKACSETIFLGQAPGFWAHISGDDRYDKKRTQGAVLRGR